MLTRTRCDTRRLDAEERRIKAQLLAREAESPYTFQPTISQRSRRLAADRSPSAVQEDLHDARRCPQAPRPLAALTSDWRVYRRAEDRAREEFSSKFTFRPTLAPGTEQLGCVLSEQGAHVGV